MSQISTEELSNYLATYLNTGYFSDYCLNGLQIEGKKNIKKIVTGVSINVPLIETAIAQNADAIIVHHGAFWKGDNLKLVGYQRERVAKILGASLNLFGYHLPLDSHPQLGNNVLLCKSLGIMAPTQLKSEPMVWCGELDTPLTPEAMTERITSLLKRRPTVCPGKKIIQKVAVCSGGAPRYFETLINENIDAYITGEASEKNFDIARETNVTFFSAGHHATERFGIMALGQHLANQFGIENIFVDSENPI